MQTTMRQGACRCSSCWAVARGTEGDEGNHQSVPCCRSRVAGAAKTPWLSPSMPLLCKITLTRVLFSTAGELWRPQGQEGAPASSLLTLRTLVSSSRNDSSPSCSKISATVRDVLSSIRASVSKSGYLSTLPISLQRYRDTLDDCSKCLHAVQICQATDDVPKSRLAPHVVGSLTPEI